LAETRDEINVVERTVRIEADPETIFSFFTDPEKMVRWMGNSATLDPRPNGVFELNIVGDYLFVGEYVEVEPYSRVVFTWGYGDRPGVVSNPLPPGSSTVEVLLVPDGEATIVRLLHRDLPEDVQSFHVLGWDNYLARLVVVGEGGDPGPDEMAAMAELLEVESDR
jgi:uncharacterized protein YndB with AHSA1/START domain